MSQRHLLDSKKNETVIIRLEELVRANSGEDSFEEVFKIVLVKIFCEKQNLLIFETSENSNLDYFNSILQILNKKWPQLLLSNNLLSKLTEEHLMVCFTEIKSIKLYTKNLEILDSFFEYLVSKNAKGEKGQFFTPRHVVECCIKIIDPKIGDCVIDPACGSGGFLIHFIRHLISKNETLNPNDIDIWGFDFDPRAIRVAKTMIALSDGKYHNLYNINSLYKSKVNTTSTNIVNLSAEDIIKTKKKKFNGFDVILTNPPFAGQIKEEELLFNYELGKNKKNVERDVLFIERCIELLKPNGKIAIVLPHNKIGGKNFSDVREWLLKHLRIVAVLSLPRTTFLPHTHQKAEIIFGIKRENSLKQIIIDEEILLMISEVDAKDRKGNYKIKSINLFEDADLWDKTEHDLDDIVNQFKEFIQKSNVEW